MGNWKSLAPILLSLVIAVTGSFLLYKWIQGQTASKEAVQVEAKAVPVAIATVDIPWGTKIRPEMVKITRFLEESLPPGSYTAADKVTDRVVLVPIKQGEPIAEHRLAPEDIKTGGVPAVLKQGKRAVAVKGDKVIGISGFINPGNRVDVLVTMEDPQVKLDKTKIVLENIAVLATGSQIEKNAKGEQAPVDVYTLEVTPEESERLALAQAEGKIQLALRNPLDGESVLTTGQTKTKTLASLSPQNPQEQPKPAAAPKAPARWVPRTSSVTVEVIKGSEVSREQFELK